MTEVVVSIPDVTNQEVQYYSLVHITGLTNTSAGARYESGTQVFHFYKTANEKADIGVKSVRLYADADEATTYVEVKSPTAIATSYTLKWPAAAPAANQTLLAAVGGQFSWGTIAPVSGASTAYNPVVFDASGSLVAGGTLGDGQLLIGRTGLAPVVGGITGTANQVQVAAAAGSITLSLPQSIHSGASPTFVGLTLTGALTVADVATFASSAIVNGAALTLAGQARFAAGTAGAPSYSFALDLNTGFYNLAADSVGFSAGGSAIGNWNSAGKFTFGASGGTQVHDINGGLAITTTLAVAGAITNAGVAVPTISSTSTFTNKSLVDDSTFFIDNLDASKRVVFELGSVPTLSTLTWTFPGVSDTFVGVGATQTLTAKTLTSPVLNTPVLTGGTINSTPIGGTTAAAGAFTTLASSGISSLNSVSIATTLGVTGASTLAALSATTIASSGLSTLNSLAVTNNATVGGTLGVTGATTLGAVSSAAATLTGGTINGMTVGATTRSTGAFTTLAANGATTLSSTLDVTDTATFSSSIISNSRIRNGDGSVGTPSYSFISYTGTGFYIKAADSVGFAANGVDIGSWGPTGDFTLGPTNFTGTHKFNASVIVQNSNSDPQYVLAKAGVNKATFYWESDLFNFYGYTLGAVAGKFSTTTGAWDLGPAAGAVNTLNGQWKYGTSSNTSTGAVDNLALPAAASIIRFSGAAPSLSGIASGAAGMVLYLTAVSGTTLTLVNDAVSTAGNRIITGSGADVVITGDGAATLIYDGTSSRWRVVSVVA